MREPLKSACAAIAARYAAHYGGAGLAATAVELGEPPDVVPLVAGPASGDSAREVGA